MERFMAFLLTSGAITEHGSHYWLAIVPMANDIISRTLISFADGSK
jgi:hypothetical protein